MCGCHETFTHYGAHFKEWRFLAMTVFILLKKLNILTVLNMIYKLNQFCFMLVQQHYRTVSRHAVWEVWADSTEESSERQANRHAPGCSICQVSISLVLCSLCLFSFVTFGKLFSQNIWRLHVKHLITTFKTMFCRLLRQFSCCSLCYMCFCLKIVISVVTIIKLFFIQVWPSWWSTAGYQ